MQRAAEIKAHQNAMHVYHVNAWNTSRLAFDGSGSVIRGKKAGFKANTMCKFQNGKTYNCDLNASYNIGARYFVREILKTLPAKARSQVEAKVPGCGRRTQCVYATLMELHTALLLMDKTKRAAA
ncbi:MAG: transposase [Oscillospiraceae bacterium]|nr:transposase [Oscillospiraceae bacterium]